MDRYDEFCGDQRVVDFIAISRANGHQTPEGAARDYVDQLIRDGRVTDAAEDEGIHPDALQAAIYADVLARIAPGWK